MLMYKRAQGPNAQCIQYRHVYDMSSWVFIITCWSRQYGFNLVRSNLEPAGFEPTTFQSWSACAANSAIVTLIGTIFQLKKALLRILNLVYSLNSRRSNYQKHDYRKHSTAGLSKFWSLQHFQKLSNFIFWEV